MKVKKKKQGCFSTDVKQSYKKRGADVDGSEEIGRKRDGEVKEEYREL